MLRTSPSTSTVRSPKKPTPFFGLPLADQVRRVQPHVSGEMASALAGDPAAADLETAVYRLSGREMFQKFLCSDTEDTDLQNVITDLIYAARAFGLAQGLLLRPEMFSQG